MKYYIGIDLGGTFIKGGVVDETGKILFKDKIPTGKERPADAVIADMGSFVCVLREKAGGHVEAVGVGSPGAVDSERGVISFNGNLGWRNVALAQKLTEITGLKTAVLNDANAAALGESFCGAGKEYDSSILVTLGTGVGGGIVLGGKLFEGWRSAGAEVGHHVICVGGEQCTCGRKGCFEAYSSATALIRDTKRAMRKHPESALWKICPEEDRVDGKTSFDGMRLNDRTATEVVENYVEYLAEGIANLINIFRPQAILLGGGVCAEGETLLKPLRARVRAKSFGNYDDAPTEIAIASLGNDAGICGAAKFAM